MDTIVLAGNSERAAAHLQQLRVEQRDLALRVARASQDEKSSYIFELKALSERIVQAASALEHSEHQK